MYSYFGENTKMIMEDGSLKKLQDIEVGDYMLYGGQVLDKGICSTTEYYIYNNNIFSGNTCIFTQDNKWRPIKDNKEYGKNTTENPIKTYFLTNENNIFILEDEQLYSDIEDNSPNRIAKTMIIEEQVELGRSFRAQKKRA